MKVDKTLYVTTKEAAQILGKSRRTAHNILQNIVDKQVELDCQPPIFIQLNEGSIFNNFYLKSEVELLINRTRTTKYKKKCCYCKRKYYAKNGERICPECSSVDKKEDVYDITACKALLRVLTSDKLYKQITKALVIFFITIILGVITACKYFK